MRGYIPPYQDLGPDEADRLIATGFLRMSPNGTSGSTLDQNVARNQAVSEVIKVVSTSLLGLSVGCAQCHPHRYDPITHADYYRLRALFEPAYNWKNWRDPGVRLVSQWSEQTRSWLRRSTARLRNLLVNGMRSWILLSQKSSSRELPACLPRFVNKPDLLERLRRKIVAMNRSS